MLGIDLGDEDIYLRFQALVLVDVGAAGHDDHHQVDLTDVLGVVADETAEGADALGDTLCVVQPVDAQDDLAAGVEAADLGGGGIGVGALRHPGVLLVVDAHGEDVHVHLPLLDVEAAELVLVAGDAVGRAQEVAHVAKGVEPDLVAAQDAVQNLLAPGQDPKDLVAGEGDVQKETDRDVGKLITDHLRQQHQLVVVDPHHVVLPQVLLRFLEELVVHLLVGVPHIVVVGGVLGEVVEVGPDGLVGEAFVVEVDLPLGQKDGGEALLGQVGTDGFFLPLVGDVLPRPTDPELIVAFVEGVEARGQAARAGVVVEFPGRAVDGHRQAVGDNYESGHVVLGVKLIGIREVVSDRNAVAKLPFLEQNHKRCGFFWLNRAPEAMFSSVPTFIAKISGPPQLSPCSPPFPIAPASEPNYLRKISPARHEMG